MGSPFSLFSEDEGASAPFTPLLGGWEILALDGPFLVRAKAAVVADEVGFSRLVAAQLPFQPLHSHLGR